MLTQDQIKQAKTIALNKLQAAGINDKFVVKLRTQLKNKNWVAMYRSRTQFTGNGRGPIFWIAEHLDEVFIQMFRDDGEDDPTLEQIISEVALSMLHEYGHVIAEYAALRSDELCSKLDAYYPGSLSNLDCRWDEERWAEDFAKHLMGRWISVGKGSQIEEIIDSFLAAAFTPLTQDTEMPKLTLLPEFVETLHATN